MSIAASAVADAAIAETHGFGECRGDAPPARTVTARADRRARAQSR